MNEPTIINLAPKKLVGLSIRTSLSENATFELWKRFRQLSCDVKSRVSSDAFSVQIFDFATLISDFSPTTLFDKWAAIEVTDFENVPAGLQMLDLQGGLYAKFRHRGSPEDYFQKTIPFIYQKWLPESIYELDDRPHFDCMGEAYKLNDPSSEEDVFIPIRIKI